jgi:hypothetical protein
MIHRDIKPQNLILTHDGGRRIIKILDFGLAKATREGDTTAHDLTGSGQWLGTPDYIAPEQSLDAARTDIRADLYSLGCTLYFLLAGRPPFKARSMYELVHAHHTLTPRPLNEIRPDVPPMLSAVVARLMAKDPTQRYQTPSEAVEALAPFAGVEVRPLPTSPVLPPQQQLNAVVAHPKPAVEARSPEAMATPVLANTRMEGSATIARVGRKRTASQAQASVRKRWRPWMLGPIVSGLLLAVLFAFWVSAMFHVRTTDATLVIEVNEPEPEVYVDGEKTTVTWTKDGKSATLHLKPGTHNVKVRKQGFAMFAEALELQSGEQRVVTVQLAEAGATDYDVTGPNRFVHFEPNAPRVVLWSGDLVRVYNLITGQPITPSLFLPKPVARAIFSPDGKWVLGWSLEDKSARLWDIATAKEVAEFNHGGPVTSAQFSLDGKLIATTSSTESVSVWDVPTSAGPCSPLWQKKLGSFAAFSPSGKRLFVGGRAVTPRLVDVATGKELKSFQDEPNFENGEFSTDGKRLVICSAYEYAQVWDVMSGKSFTPPLRHAGVVSARFSPDGTRLVTFGTGEDLVWDVATSAAVTTPFDHKHFPGWKKGSARFSPDGRTILTVNHTERFWLWNVRTGQTQFSPPLNKDPVRDATFGPEGKVIVTTSYQSASMWNSFNGQLLKTVTISPN